LDRGGFFSFSLFAKISFYTIGNIIRKKNKKVLMPLFDRIMLRKTYIFEPSMINNFFLHD